MIIQSERSALSAGTRPLGHPTLHMPTPGSMLQDTPLLYVAPVIHERGTDGHVHVNGSSDLGVTTVARCGRGLVMGLCI